MDACNARQVWLASISHWPHGRNLPFERWGRGVTLLARRGIVELLDGVGDPDMERGFAMVMTMCAHRAVTDDELAGLPPGKSVHLAGAGVRELWRTPLFPAPGLSLQRCERAVFTTWHGIKVPGDCGECPPCLVRAELERERSA